LNATAIFAALLVCAFPFAGLLVGLGPSRFWEALGWVCGHIATPLFWLFCGGAAQGEWIASKLWRKSNVDGN
jgi:hypothetical protein